MTDTFSHEDSTNVAGSTPDAGGRLRRNMVAAGAGVVVVVLAATLLIPRPAAEDEHDAIFHRFTGDIRERVIANEHDWLAAAGFPVLASAPERIEHAIGSIRAAVDDPDHLLADGTITSLMETIKEHALARSERSPARYLALCDAESELYDWVSLDDAALKMFLDYWQNISTAPGGTSRDALINVWNYFYDEKGDRFDAIGAPPMGSRVVIRKVRTKDQSHEQFFGYDEEEIIHHWTGQMMLTGALQFRKPRRPIEEALAASPGVVVAQVMILVRMANGYPISWITSWFQDPATGRWVCSWSAQKRARGTVYVF